MSRRIPMLGYATKTDAAMALKAEGLSNHQIAERFGNPYTARDIAEILRWGGRRKSGPVETWNTHVSSSTFQALRPHAIARSLSVKELISKLIENIAKDDLVDAILDDRIVREAA